MSAKECVEKLFEDCEAQKLAKAKRVCRVNLINQNGQMIECEKSQKEYCKSIFSLFDNNRKVKHK